MMKRLFIFIHRMYQEIYCVLQNMKDVGRIHLGKHIGLIQEVQISWFGHIGGILYIS